MVFEKITEYGDNLLPGAQTLEERGNTHTISFLSNLNFITVTLSDKANPIPMENFIKEFKRLQEARFSGKKIHPIHDQDRST